MVQVLAVVEKLILQQFLVSDYVFHLVFAKINSQGSMSHFLK